MIKQVSTEYEQQKGKLRNVRKRYMDKVKVIEKAKTISEDEIKQMKKQIDGITDSVTKEMTEMMKKKEKELEIWLAARKFPPFLCSFILDLLQKRSCLTMSSPTSECTPVG